MNLSAPYPDAITPQILASYAGIADAEVERDIAATERDLEDQRRKADAHAIDALAHGTSPRERSQAQSRADNAAYHIAQMKALLAFLRKLLAARRAMVTA